MISLKRSRFLILFIWGFGLWVAPLHAQCERDIYRDCSQIGIPDLIVWHDTVLLPLSGIGGINNLQVYDFSRGNNRQLLLFDRDGDRLNFLRWENGEFQFFKDKRPWYWYNSMPNWLAYYPPPLYHWVVVTPGLCDEYKYIFTATCDNRVRLLKARPVEEGFGYEGLEILSDSLKYWDGNKKKNLIVNAIDIPGVADVDGDGDLDILTFAPQGGTLQWFRNESGECGKFELVLADTCWGHFFETGITRAVLLDTCPGFASDTGVGLQRGSTVLPYDFDGNGLTDVALGDLNFNNINVLYNGGTPQNAHIISQDTAFPSANVPVDIPQFPATFLLDADFDGDRDILVAPSSLNNGLDIGNLWYYENTDTTGGMNLELKARDFLQDQVLDWGRNSGVSLLDEKHLVMSIGSSKGPEGEKPGRLILYKIEFTAPSFEIVLLDSNYGRIDRYGFQDICATFGDLNNDSVPDLVIGDDQGKLYYAYLDGSTSPPGIPQLQPFSPEIDVGSNACPTLGRVDKDGLRDLLVGERNGNINYFKNYGTKETPEFHAIPDDDFFGEIDTREPGDTSGYSAPSLGFCPYNSDGLVVGSKNGPMQFYILYRNDSIVYVEGYPMDERHTFVDLCIDVGSYSRPAYMGDIGLGYYFFGNSRGGLEIYFQDVLEGIEKREKTIPFNLYPNPAGNHLVISTGRPGDQELTIHAPDGRLIMRKHYQGSKNMTLDISHLPSGLYLITLKNSRGHASRLFVKNGY